VANLKICLLTDKSGNVDEGMKRVGHHLSNELSRRNDVLEIDPKGFTSTVFWKSIRNFSPDVIHFVPGITLNSIILLRILKQIGGKTTITALVPRLAMPSLCILNTLKPDAIFVSSVKWEIQFRGIGIRTIFLPMGVNLDKFTPEKDKEHKVSIKSLFGLDEEKFTVLHVGHIQRGRNIEVLSEVVKLGCQVVFVATTSTNPDHKLLRQLLNAGVIVLRRFFPNMEDIYTMADCYIFPAFDERFAVNIPLSILEAMSCDLPIITTMFGGLPKIFREETGFMYAHNQKEILEKVKKVMKGDVVVKTRKLVEPYSWPNVVTEFEKKLKKIVID